MLKICVILDKSVHVASLGIGRYKEFQRGKKASHCGHNTTHKIYTIVLSELTEQKVSQVVFKLQEKWSCKEIGYAPAAVVWIYGPLASNQIGVQGCKMS